MSQQSIKSLMSGIYFFKKKSLLSLQWQTFFFNLKTFYFGMLLDLQKSCRYIIEFPSILYPPSPNVNILYNHSTCVKTRKLSVVKYYQLNHRFYVDFTSFSPNGLFSFQDPVQDTHYIQSLCLLSLFHSVNFSSCWS